MKKKCRVRFTFIEIYHFSRCLGIDKVPERGNNPLGMESNHFKSEKFDITKKKLKDIHLNADGDNFVNIARLCTSTPKSSKASSFCDFSEDDNDSIHSIMSIDYTRKSLQPLNPIQRKKCLENAGVNVDKNEQSEKNPKILSKLREDRKQVGCKCSNVGKCDVSKCICNNEGIPCQSDGNKFPCKCGDKCSNKFGKRIYSYAKIKFHYQHTLSRNVCHNVDTNIDSLSTLSGDCAICGHMSDDAWKNYSETYHQTRARKRAGDQNNHSLKFLKQLVTVDEGFSSVNGTSVSTESNVLSEVPLSDFVVNNQEEFNNKDDYTVSVEAVLDKHPMISKQNSMEMESVTNPISKIDMNKENIDFIPFKIKKEYQPNKVSDEIYFSFDSKLNKSLTQLINPTTVPNGSLLSSSLTTSQTGTDDNNCVSCPHSFFPNYFPINISDNSQSFVSKESMMNIFLSTSFMNLYPIKLNHISMEIDSSMSAMKNEQLTISTKNLTPPPTKSLALCFSKRSNYQGNCDELEESFPEDILKKEEEISTEYFFESTSVSSSNQHTPDQLQVTPTSSDISEASSGSGNFVKSVVTKKLKRLHLGKSFKDFSLISEKVKKKFSTKNHSNYSKSIKKLISPKKNEIHNFLEPSISINSPSENFMNCQSNIELKPFRFSEEITFFDIPYQIDENLCQPDQGGCN